MKKKFYKPCHNHYCSPKFAKTSYKKSFDLKIFDNLSTKYIDDFLLERRGKAVNHKILKEDRRSDSILRLN